MILERELARIQAACEAANTSCATERFASGKLSSAASGELFGSAELTAEELNLASSLGETAISSFIAGRTAAHRALGKLPEYRQQPILRFTGSRLPDFPGSYVGSIAHSTFAEEASLKALPATSFGLAVACVSTQLIFRSVGIDLEASTRRCSESLVRRITSPDDIVSDLKSIEVFSLKEAVYKCAFGLDRRVRSFRELVLVPAKLKDPRLQGFDRIFTTDLDLADGSVTVTSGLLQTEYVVFTFSSVTTAS